MNILVTGANGQLGNGLRIVSAESRNYYVFTDVAELDITDSDAVMKAVRGWEPDVIVNCAAYTDVEKAEDDRERADLINHAAVANLARAAAENGSCLIHVSTDYVFGGERCAVPFREDQDCTPVNVYGETKLLGEKAVIESGCRYLIIRTAWLYSETGNGFLKKMLSLTAGRPLIKVVFDQTGTPTYALDLAKAIYHIIESGKFRGNGGIYHYSDEGVCSRYDFAKAIAAYAGHDRCRIEPCRSSEFPTKAVRPGYSVLDKTKIKAVFGLEIPHWTESLKECISKMEKL